MKLARLLAFLLGCVLTVSAGAQTLPIPLLTGPSDPSQMNQNINSLIRQLNNILQPVIYNPSGAVNLVSLTGGLTGAPAIIGLQTGADTNAGITLNPNGSGNLTLFSQTDTGVLQFGNQTSFIKAAGLVACPAVPGGKSPMGVSPVVTGYFAAKDWLGIPHAIVAC